MTEQKPKRLIGRVDKREGAWGYLVTEDWISYFWHEDDVQGKIPPLHSLVSFEPAPPAQGGQRPRAVNVKLEKTSASPEFFGKFARYVRERNEEVA